MHRTYTHCLSLALSVLACSAALAHPESQQAGNEYVPASPLRTVPIEPEVEAVVNTLVGTFESPAAGDRPSLLLSSARVNIDTLPGAVYFEIAHADGIGLAHPFRTGVFWVHKARGVMRLRVLDFAGNTSLKDMLVGMHLTPDMFPAIDPAALSINVDLPLTEHAGVYTGSTPAPVPTSRDGALEMAVAVRLAAENITFNEQGFSATGTQVWGVSTMDPASGSGLTFLRTDKKPATVTRTPDGLIVITLTQPKPGQPKLVEGGEVFVHYSGWLCNSTGFRFDSSRQPGREPFRIRLPGGVIKGWNEGMKEITRGERRRLIIPPALGYGSRGAQRGGIPPNATLVFDIECLFIDNTDPTPVPPTPTPPTSTSEQPK